MDGEIFIYQIGRIESNIFDRLKFSIDGRDYETTLSSFAIRDHKGMERSKVVLIYPVSLFFNSSLLKNQRFVESAPQEFIKCLEKALENPWAYLEDPESYFGDHPHSKEANSFFVIPSLGTYRTNRETLSFDVSYTDIWLKIFVHMVKTYLDSNGNRPEYIIDISSGLNIYVSALIQATRYFGVFVQLASLDDKSSATEISFAFSDPILPGSLGVLHNVYFERLEVESIFFSPIKKEDIDRFSLSRSLFPENRPMKRKLQTLLENFGVTFSSIQNNTPLAIYQFGYDDSGEVKAFLQNLILDFESKLAKNYIHSPNLDRRPLMKTFFSMGLYWGIIKLLKDKGVSAMGDEGSDLEEIKRAFVPVYELLKLMLNEVLLEDELLNLRKKLENKDLKEEWVPLYNLLYPEQKAGSPSNRNFFAHSGLERTVTMVRRDAEKILLKYDGKYHEKIRRWLIDSL